MDNWNFDFEVLEECNKDELNDKEIYYIDFYNTLYPNGYNKTKGGNNPHTSALKDLDTVKEIQELLKVSKLSNVEISEIYGVSDQTICDINSGRIWYEDDIKYPIRNIRQINKKTTICKHCGKELKYKNKNTVCQSCYDKFYRNSHCPPKDEYLLVHGDYDGFSEKGVSRLVMMLGFKPTGIFYGHLHRCSYDDISGVKIVRSGCLSGTTDDYTISKRFSGTPSQMVCIADTKGIRTLYPIELD